MRAGAVCNRPGSSLDREGPGDEESVGHSLEEQLVFRVLAVILVVAWLLGVSVFHVAGGLIHLLLLVAVISILWHFIAGRRTSA